MASLKDIKKRISAVKNIQRITSTMQMIATAKFTAALQKAAASKPYTESIHTLVGEVAAAAGDVEHPLLAGPSNSPRKELVLVIGSDRGLCGAYNGNVLREAINHIRAAEKAGTSVDVEVAGKKPMGFFKFQNVPVLQQYTVGDKPKFEDVKAIADRYIEAFSEGNYDAVRVVYMRYVSNARQVPEILQLMPMTTAAADSAGGASDSGSGAGAANYEFSPSSEELLGDLLPKSVVINLYQAFNDAVVSEQIMRMVAMKAATENAGDIGKSLKRDFNRARQTQITTELMEVISGAAALD